MKHIKWPAIPIKWKIYIYLLGFSLLLLFVLWLFQIVFLEQFYKNVKSYEIQADSNTIARYIEDNNIENLQNAISSRKDLYVEIWVPGSGAALVSGNYPDGVQAQLTLREKLRLFDTARQNGGSTVQRYFYDEIALFSSKRKESILYARIIPISGQDALLMVSATLSPVSATVATLRIQLYIVVVVMILLSAVIAMVMSKHVAKPIERLNAGARELARGNYDVSFAGAGYREIDELADTLNLAAGELSKTEHLRQELIANISHDLRTPLTLITGYSEMIRDFPDENTPENMEVIIDESKRLTSLVNDLMELSKLQSGTQQMHFERASLTACVDKIVERFGKFREKDGYDITLEHDGEVFCSMDAEAIARVVYNYMVNALTHTGADKRITVRQSVSDGRALIEVSDSGEGIAPEDIPYIWDRYYKVDKVHRRAVTGSGLGLSIVKGILGAHPCAEYGVRSAPGMGSTFWFSLPVAPEQ